MSELNPSWVLIPAAAVLAPLVVRALARWVRVPLVVFELALGIVIGPSVLGWAAASESFDLLAEFGLCMLFFVAGSEIDFTAFRGGTGRRAIGGWVVSLALGIAVGWAIAPGEAAIVLGIAMCSTALGTLMPMLRDAHELTTGFGRTISAIGAVGEFAPLIAISLFLGGRDLGVTTLVLLAFVVVVGIAVVFAFRVPRGGLHRIVNATLHTSGQFAIRMLFLVLAILVAVSALLDLDLLLGAFAAGAVWRLVMRDADPADRHAVESKIEGVAFGFLIPLFFVYTGITFDLQALLATPVLLALVPIVALGLLVVRGIPASFAVARGTPLRDRAATALLGATALPIIVAVTNVGVDDQIITSAQASLLVGAGMLSVLLFPLAAMSLRGAPLTVGAADDDDRA